MISVIIPVKNGEQTIADQLTALACQSDEAIGRWELIIADNGSSDHTRDVVRSFAAMLPLRIVDASAGVGPAAARNAGAHASRGTFLVFTDADDIVGPNWLAAWRDAADAIGFGTGPLERLQPGADGPSRLHSAGFEPPRHMGFLPYALGTNFGVNREAFDRCAGFDERFRTGEDVELSWRLQLAGIPLEPIPDAVVAKRLHHRATDILRQYFAYGRSDPHLYRDFRQMGLARPAARPTIKSYAGLVARLPLLVFPRQREAWLHQLGRRAGRIIGSIEARVFLP